MVQSYIKMQNGKILVYQPCSDGFVITSQWNEPPFFKAFHTWEELVEFVGAEAQIAFNVPLARDFEDGDCISISSFVMVA